MKDRMSRLLAAILFLSFVVSGCREETAGAPVSTAGREAEQAPLYLDPAAPTTARVEDLLARMTLPEKIGQMTLIEKNSVSPEAVSDQFLGGVLSGGGGSPNTNSAEAWAEMVAAYQEAALQTRLAIPLLYGVDAIHGHNNVKGATIFPHNVGLGATRNPELVAQIGQATAVEVRATGIHWNYAPVLAVPQDIRWGRAYEAYGEDTELVTLLGTAYLQGLQGDDLSDAGSVLATPKHFVGDGGTTWGSSTTDDYRIDQGDTRIDEATLRAVHLPPYQAAVDAGAMSIMVSFSSWNGTKMHAHKYLLTDVLKGELGFAGFLVSDWQAIDQIYPADYYLSVVTAVNAGIDMNMAPYDSDRFIGTLTRAVEQGDVSEARIDDAVRRILTVKFDLGLFEQPLTPQPTPATVGSAEHRRLARQAVRESLVLLHHDGDTLPVRPDIPVIFVAGEAADDVGIQSGGWTIEWQGRAGNVNPGTTILEAVEESVSAGTDVYYNRFGNFDRVGDGDSPIVADVGIAVVGERPYAEGIGDSNDLSLSAGELATVERMRDRSERLIVIVVSGRPLIITDLLPMADAVIAAWLPGSEGQGITDVLFGDYEFSGTLPYTWPRAMDQLPFDFDDLPSTGCAAPLFPFGYGLKTNDPPTALPACS